MPAELVASSPVTRAIVLVGGFGTRLRPLTNSIPKQMLPIVNRPMIEHVLDHLAAHGIGEAVLSLGYRPDAFREAYPASRHGDVELTYAVEPEPLDTAGAIRFAADHAGVDDTFVVCNGDVLTDLDIADLVARHRAAGATGTIALHRVADPSAFGVVPTDSDGRVQAFVEKPPPGEAPTDAINAGTYVLEPAVLERIAAGEPVSIERVTFPEMVAAGELYAFVSDTYWIDTGTPATYLQAQLDLLDGVRGAAPAGVAEGARLAADAQVQRSAIADGVTVGERASITDSVVMAGATIGEGAVVAGSIVGPQANVGADAQLRDLSVLGAAAEVAEGESLHGVRRPEPT